MKRSPRIVELLAWCLPALGIGLLLRVMLALAMPYAYVQHDSIRLLVSGESWLADDFDLMSNYVPFLVPAFCRVAQAAPWPGLVTIQLVQHVLGILQIVVAGAIVRLWFPRWKVWIVPVTLVFALHPSFLWFEHTVMLETWYVFAIMLVALAGTCVARERTLGWAALFCITIFLVAVTRPEGKLFVPSAAALLTGTFWRQWRQLAAASGLWAITAGAVALSTVPGESGLLLYSSVLHLSPAESKHFPEAAPYVAKLREEAIERAAREPAFVSRPQREALMDALTKFVAEHPDAGRGETLPARMNRVAGALAYETCSRQPWALLPLALQKFRATAGELANGKLTKSWMHERQSDRIKGAWRFLQPISKRLWGREFANADQASAFVMASCPPGINWFTQLHEEWGDLYSRRFEATRYATMKLPGLPLLYLMPIAGMILAIFCDSRLRRFHGCWITMLTALWFIIMITANERARFRMAFEPFIFLYALLALAFVSELAARAWRQVRRGSDAGEATAPTSA